MGLKSCNLLRLLKQLDDGRSFIGEVGPSNIITDIYEEGQCILFSEYVIPLIVSIGYKLTKLGCGHFLNVLFWGILGEKNVLSLWATFF